MNRVYQLQGTKCHFLGGVADKTQITALYILGVCPMMMIVVKLYHQGVR